MVDSLPDIKHKNPNCQWQIADVKQKAPAVRGGARWETLRNTLTVKQLHTLINIKNILLLNSYVNLFTI